MQRPLCAHTAEYKLKNRRPNADCIKRRIVQSVFAPPVNWTPNILERTLISPSSLSGPTPLCTVNCVPLDALISVHSSILQISSFTSPSSNSVNGFSTLKTYRCVDISKLNSAASPNPSGVPPRQLLPPFLAPLNWISTRLATRYSLTRYDPILTIFLTTSWSHLQPIAKIPGIANPHQ